MKQIPDKSVDMILCDLPYGTTACKWDTVIPFDKLWEQYNRIIKDNGVICLFGTEPFASKLRISNIKYYRYDWVWNKGSHSNPLLAKKQPLRVYENICVFYKKQSKYIPQMVQGTPYKKDYGYKKHSTDSFGKTILIDRDNNTGLRYPKNVINIGQNKNNRATQHPTQKPVALCEYLIKTYTNEGDVVLDNCMGSGTTGVACKNLGRKFVGIELDTGYFKVAENRIKGGVL
jgi:site-specific DNA-methyltransferase (adenine-specific)